MRSRCPEATPTSDRDQRYRGATNGRACRCLLHRSGCDDQASAIYVRSRRFERLVKDRPQLLYWQGEYLDEVLKRERVTRDEVLAAMRDGDVTHHESAIAVLETDGSLTVTTVQKQEMPLALEGAKRD